MAHLFFDYDSSDSTARYSFIGEVPVDEMVEVTDDIEKGNELVTIDGTVLAIFERENGDLVTSNGTVLGLVHDETPDDITETSYWDVYAEENEDVLFELEEEGRTLALIGLVHDRLMHDVVAVNWPQEIDELLLS